MEVLYGPEFLLRIRNKLAEEIKECQRWIDNHPEAPSMEGEDSDQYTENCQQAFNHDSMPVRLADAKEAIARVENSALGICIGYGPKSCGVKIPEDRLLACPTAKRCAGCQQKHEKKFGRKYY